MNVELISIHNAKSPRTKDADAVLRSIKMDDAFAITGDRLVYKNRFSCTYKIFDWFSKDGLVGVLHEFSYSALNARSPDEALVISFSDMLRDFKRNLHDLQAEKIETLWDDIGLRYGRLAYPRIISLENKMRSLITRFMLKHLGAEWIKSSPTEVKDEISKTRRTENGVDLLHNVDFKTLGTFLTKKYSLVPQEILYERITELDPTAAPGAMESQIALIKEGVPRSNWTRYFKEIVACQDTEFSKKWNDLYDLRCRVAHSSFLSRLEYNEVLKLSDDLDRIVDEAIKNLQQVHVNRQEAAVLADDLNRLVEASGALTVAEGEVDFPIPPIPGDANHGRIDLRRDYWACINSLISMAEWSGLSKTAQGALAPRVAQSRLIKENLLPKEIADYLDAMKSNLNNSEWKFDRVSYRRYKHELKKIRDFIEIRLTIIRDRVIANAPDEDDVDED
jgi:hypothetical protein